MTVDKGVRSDVFFGFLGNLRPIVVKAHFHLGNLPEFSGFNDLLDSQKIAVKAPILVALDLHALFSCQIKQGLCLFRTVGKGFLDDDIFSCLDDLPSCHGMGLGRRGDDNDIDLRILQQFFRLICVMHAFPPGPIIPQMAGINGLDPDPVFSPQQEGNMVSVGALSVSIISDRQYLLHSVSFSFFTHKDERPWLRHNYANILNTLDCMCNVSNPAALRT